MRRRIVAGAALALTLAAVAAAGSGAAPALPGACTLLTRSEAQAGTGAGQPGVVGHVPAGGGSNPRWKGSQRRFGGSVTTYKGVVYQPNVVVIGGGASAIRAESPDGLTWTLAGSAPGVSDLRVGKI